MRLTKHHGLGNDFLVVIDLDASHPTGPELAISLCDRRTGIGADGLLWVTDGDGDADVTMRLLNADGSSAEMSGNGIRCLAQAVFQAGLVAPPVLKVATEAGMRTVRVLSQPEPDCHRMSVEMGVAQVGEETPEWVAGQVLRAVRVEVGNPHIVLLWGGTELPNRDELITMGSHIDHSTPGGANVEVFRPLADGLAAVVYERGVGPTLSCGTGSCAVAAAAQQWGITGEHTTVEMPGGALEITLGEPVLLTGDTRSVATIETPWP